MATTTIEFAWAVPVDVVQLGAHLEAYDKLQPTLNALRLCNRFGRGDKAAITKLPVELVQHVEDYLMIEERGKLLSLWATDLTCWEGECRPIDHLSNAEILNYYNDWLGSMTPGSCFDEDWWEVEFCKSCEVFHQRTELTLTIKETVAKLMIMDYDDTGDGDSWYNEHDKRVMSWFSRVGAPTEKSRGSFNRLSAILVKHFGLEIWSSHVQEEGHPVFRSSNNNHSTKAYLRLPTKSSVQYEVRPDVADYQIDPMREKTEAGFAGAISLTPHPVDKCLERFTRAVKALDLCCIFSETSASILNFKNGKQPDNNSGDEASVLPGTLGPPQLTMFVRADDPTEDW